MVKHQSFVSKVGHYNNSPEINENKLNDIWVIEMRRTGTYNCESKFASLSFYCHEIQLRIFRIYSDNTEAGKCVQTI